MHDHGMKTTCKIHLKENVLAGAIYEKVIGCLEKINES